MNFRVQEGKEKWARDPERLQFYQMVSDENEKCRTDDGYVPPKSFIQKINKFLPAELIVQGPYRKGTKE